MSGVPLRILDFGGAAGVDFANLLKSISDCPDVQYGVVDLPEVCVFGKRYWADDRRLVFYDSMPQQGERFDLIYSSWALQYVDDPLALLEKFTAYHAKAILIINVPFTRGAPFVRVQTNKMLRSWVLSLPDTEEVMRKNGYALRFHVAGDVDHNVDNYAAEYRVSNVSNLLFLKL